MNKQFILELVKETLDSNGNLDINDFEKYFGSLEDEEKVEVELLLNEHNIKLVYDSEINKVVSVVDYKPLGKMKDIKLTNEQLCLLYQQGNPEGLSLLIIKNEKLIYSRALKYNKIFNHKLELDDLFQSGAIGLMVAAKRFDNSLGFKFTTYAIHWIDQKINRDIIDLGFTIRIPVHVVEKINKMLALRRKNDSEDEKEIRKLIKEELNYNDETINNLQALSKNIMTLAALSTPVGDGDNYLGDFIEDKTTLSVDDEIESTFLKEEINKALEHLKTREKDVLKLRFGLDGNDPHTLEQIGEKQEVTRERIRQIEAKALRKLRMSNKSKHLRGYLTNE